MNRLMPLLALFCFIGLAFGQGEATYSQAVPSQLDADYRLGTGDLIEISVFGVEEFQYSVRIGSSGSVTLPYLGSVSASGKTASELARELEEQMDGKLFRNPSVSILVREYRSNPVVVLGAVNKPGTYQKVNKDLTLIDLLAQAEGVSPLAGDDVIIQRQQGNSPGEPEVIKISLKDLFAQGNKALNIPLQAGDVVNIPPRDEEKPVFYVIGEVIRPGAFNLPTKSDMYITQAIASAGGTLKTAKLKDALLVRYDESGARKEIAINFKKVLEGKQPDIPLKAQDVVFIPGSNIKTIGYGLLGIIPGTIQQTTSQGIIR